MDPSWEIKETHGCLFSAPYRFLGNLFDEFQSFIPTEFSEIWHYEELAKRPEVIAWIPNPGQLFIIEKRVLAAFPTLKVIVTPSTGLNHIDRQACSSRGVEVYSLLDRRDLLEGITASAEFTFLLLLNALRRLDVAVEEVRERRMRIREDLLRGHELAGKRVGLVGLGRNGRRLARYLNAFDARIAYSDPNVADVSLTRLSLDELFETSQIVCVCCALTPQTQGMIGYSLLRRLPEGAVFVNTSRGEVVSEGGLLRILRERPDLRVGLDVISGEVEDRHRKSPLLPYHDSGQIVVTPHIAGATVESQTKAARATLEILKAVLGSEVILQSADSPV
jgi:lactate dehydrogenase-like 2-hydroxyacid dehydrogenase